MASRIRCTRLIARTLAAWAFVSATEAWDGRQSAEGEPPTGSEPELLRVYEVRKQVRAFPAQEDLSTPEAAYATFNRLCASGEQGSWKRLSIPRLAQGLPPASARPRVVSSEAAEEWLDAEVLEVRVFRGVLAAVLARTKDLIDIRFLERVDGRWLNAGNDLAASVDDARGRFSLSCGEHPAADVLRPVRNPVADADAHLKPFVEFLKNQGQAPEALVRNALAKHRIVILGEVHHRPAYWEFNTALIQHPDFARSVGTIYMELPANGQHLIEQFLAAERAEAEPVIEMLRDMLWMGWPDQSMLDFFLAVWRANQRLEPQRRLRIVLADVQRPWSQIRKREDWRRYEVDRDRFMAESILSDLKQQPSGRNALFLVGVGHAMLDLKYFDGMPVKSAGWHLREAMGREAVFAVFPHMPVQTNWGRVDGRVCLGLFDSAFVALGRHSVGVPLSNGPFGEQPFDAFPDRPVRGLYRDGYDAYLYLGPLEGERFSYLIPGFYDAEFTKELDRRHRIMFGKGLVEGCGLNALNEGEFVRWMKRSWGQPRAEWSKASLGPMDAWRFGSRRRHTRHPEGLPQGK